MDKACPVVMRNRDGQLEILVFRHPLAGIQLVKGTIEPGETSLEASDRELREEAGVILQAKYQLLKWQRRPGEPTWGICIMETGNIVCLTNGATIAKTMEAILFGIFGTP